MNGDVEEEAPRPRPLSAGIWTLFSWLRRTDRSSSSESVTSVGSDRTVASFDFLAPLNYKNANTPLVLPQDPLTDTYKKRLQERNLRRQHDRDLTLRRKYGLFREEGLGYDAFSLPTARRLEKSSIIGQDRERRATSESIQRRSAYVPGKRRAPLPPTVVTSASLPRTYKRKRPAPKPPVKLSKENKENVAFNKIMNPTSDVGKHLVFGNDIVPANKSDKHLKNGTKEVKLRTDKGFLKQIFDNKKRNSAIDTSHIKLLPSISELDRQAAKIIEANKLLRNSIGNNSNYSDDGLRSASGSCTEETWICTTCLRKYKSVVKCCIYCVIKENSPNNKNIKNVATNASNICTQTDEKILKNLKPEPDDKKKLREMLKEMKDSLPKRPKHNDKFSEENRDEMITSTETPTLRIGFTIDENVKDSSNNAQSRHSQNISHVEDSIKSASAKKTFLMSQPSSSKQLPVNRVPITKRHSVLDPSPLNLNHPFQNVFSSNIMESVKESPSKDGEEVVLTKKVEKFCNDVFDITNKSSELENINKLALITANNGTKTTNGIVDNKKNSETLPEQIKENVKDLHRPLDNNNNSGKVVELTETPVNINDSKIIVNDKKSIQKNKDSGSGSQCNIERIELGKVFSPNAIKIDQMETNVNLNNSRNINLHTPLKISSLLNPLYCPKYKKSNEKVPDSNFGNILTTQSINKITNKNAEASSNVQITLPNISVAPSTSTQFQSTSKTKFLHIELQKSEASPKELSTEKKLESSSIENEDINKIVNNDSSNIVKANEPGAMDHYDRRRHLINQLEQAISKGDEQLAAEAAAKLAKLKLACSVLSFSSQIVADNPNKREPLKDNNVQREGKISAICTKENSSNIRQIESSLVLNKSLNDEKVKTVKEDQKPTSTLIPHKKPENNFQEATTSNYNRIANDEIIPIEIWVEDKEAARGPIPLHISRKARIGQLKRHVEMSLGIEIALQRWIVGRTLCTDDNAQLVNLAGHDLNAPFYLCLVESDTNKDDSPQAQDDVKAESKNSEQSEINNAPSNDVYTELMKLEQQALVPNTEEFECGVCIEQCTIGAGAVLRECIHTFCKECLADVVRHCDEPVVACPAIECPGTLQEREIRALLSTEEHDRWLARGLAAAESGTRNTFHCRTRDCKGWAFCEPGVRRFPCPVCKHTNCVLCQAVHEGETCEQYQAKLRVAVTAAESNQTDEGTQALLKSLISRGEALECPECNAIITKKWGCDWVKCSACKTEICWITKGRRWGPGGKGDTSGGCRCGIDGKRCHPSCGYCH